MRNNNRNINIKTRMQYMLVILFIICDASLIGPFITSFIKEHKIPIFWIGVILSSKNISRMLFDIPTSFLSQVFGVKFNFVLSRLARFASIALLMYKQNIPFFILSMVLYGLSMASFYGKIELYLIQVSNKKSHFNGRIILSYYSLIGQITMMISGVCSSYLFPEIGYISLSYYTILISIGSLLLLPLMPIAKEGKSKTKQNNQVNSFTSFKQTCKQIVGNTKVLQSAIILSIVNFVIWRSNTILNLTLLSNNIKPQYISIISTMHFCFNIAGYSIYFLIHNIKMLHIKMMYILSITIAAITLPMINIISLICLLIISITLPMVQIFYERKLISIFRDKNEAGIVISFTNSISSMYAILSGILYGLSLRYCNPSFALITAVYPMIAIGLIGYFVTKDKSYILHKN